MCLVDLLWNLDWLLTLRNQVLSNTVSNTTTYLSQVLILIITISIYNLTHNHSILLCHIHFKIRIPLVCSIVLLDSTTGLTHYIWLNVLLCFYHHLINEYVIINELNNDMSEKVLPETITPRRIVHLFSQWSVVVAAVAL